MNTQETQPLLVLAGLPMTEAEYVDSQRNVRRTSRLLRLAWPISAGFFGFIAVFLAREVSGDVRFLSSLGWLGFAVVLAVVTAVTRKKREKEELKTAYGVYRRMRGEEVDQVRFYRDHLETESNRRRLYVPYSDIREFSEDAEKFVLFADHVLVVVPARTLTAAQAGALYGILAEGLPDGRLQYKDRLQPLRLEPLPVPDYPARPVTPPKALHQPPVRMVEAGYRHALAMEETGSRTVLIVAAGLLTGLLLDPTSVLAMTDGLCIVVWALLSRLMLLLAARSLAKRSPSRLLGLSPATDGVTVYIRGGEMFVPYELLSAQDAREGLVVQTPLGVLYLRYDSLPDPEAVKRYFGL